jgi:hypothetical protein
VKLADTPSPRHPLGESPEPETNSFFFYSNKLSFRTRSRQQRPVGTRCGQSVQNPVRSFGSNAWLGAPCLRLRLRRDLRSIGEDFGIHDPVFLLSRFTDVHAALEEGTIPDSDALRSHIAR